MERLNLEMKTHPNPYAIRWTKEVGVVKVNVCCKLSFYFASIMMRCIMMMWLI